MEDKSRAVPASDMTKLAERLSSVLREAKANTVAVWDCCGILESEWDYRRSLGDALRRELSSTDKNMQISLYPYFSRILGANESEVAESEWSQRFLFKKSAFDAIAIDSLVNDGARRTLLVRLVGKDGREFAEDSIPLQPDVVFPNVGDDGDWADDASRPRRHRERVAPAAGDGPNDDLGMDESILRQDDPQDSEPCLGSHDDNGGDDSGDDQGVDPSIPPPPPDQGVDPSVPPPPPPDVPTLPTIHVYSNPAFGGYSDLSAISTIIGPGNDGSNPGGGGGGGGGNGPSKTPWYDNQCLRGVAGNFAISAGVDFIGFIPEAGGVARMIGHEAGYVGVVADKVGTQVIHAGGKTAGVANSARELSRSEWTSWVSAGITVLDFVPVVNEFTTVAALAWDTGVAAYKGYQCLK